MSSDAIEEIFKVIESLEMTVKTQNELIVKLINENVEQENFISEVLKRDYQTDD